MSMKFYGGFICALGPDGSYNASPVVITSKLPKDAVEAALLLRSEMTTYPLSEGYTQHRCGLTEPSQSNLIDLGLYTQRGDAE